MIWDRISEARRRVEGLVEEYREAAEVKLRLWSRSKVAIKCLSCGAVDIVSRSRVKCPLCGSTELKRLSKAEFVEEYVKWGALLRERHERFLGLVEELVKRAIEHWWWEDRFKYAEVSTGRFVFDKPSYVKLERDGSLEAYFHWFGEPERALYEALEGLARERGFKLRVIVDARPDHCKFEEELMERMGFERQPYLYYVKEVKADKDP